MYKIEKTDTIYPYAISTICKDGFKITVCQDKDGTASYQHLKKLLIEAAQNHERGN